MSTAGRLSIAIVLLAAGQAKRMGGEHHKLLAEFDGVPLVRRMAQAAIAANPDAVIIVTGHRHAEVTDCLIGLDVELVHNSAYADGMAGSVVAGFRAPSVIGVDGIMIMLADMPAVTSNDLKRLIAAFTEADGKAVVRAVASGKRGNPVILPQGLRDSVFRLTGDIGARQIIENCGLEIIDVEIGAAAHLDVDTPEAVTAAGGILKG